MKKLTKLEHSTLLIECDGRRIAIDPGSMTSTASRAKLRGVDAVLVTHQHGDHYDSAVLREISAPVFGPTDVAGLASACGLTATPLLVGVPVTIAGMTVTAVSANHGPAVQNPVQNVGYVIQVDQNRCYVTGDMAGPQGPLPAGPFTLVALPVEGEGFVFTAQEAVEFLRSLSHTGFALAVHADETPGMREEFAMLASTFCKPVMLGIGEAVEI